MAVGQPSALCSLSQFLFKPALRDVSAFFRFFRLMGR
jgi:hypothetical protein